MMLRRVRKWIIRKTSNELRTSDFWCNLGFTTEDTWAAARIWDWNRERPCFFSGTAGFPDSSSETPQKRTNHARKTEFLFSTEFKNSISNLFSTFQILWKSISKFLKIEFENFTLKCNFFQDLIFSVSGEKLRFKARLSISIFKVLRSIFKVFKKF